MNRTFLNGFVYVDEEEAFFLEDEVKVITMSELRERFGKDVLTYVGYMAFNDGEYANVYANKVLKDNFYVVFFDTEDEWIDSPVY